MNKLRPSELGIAALGAFLFITLAGAETAAVLFGHQHLLPATGGLLYALVRLPHHLTDPRAAWAALDRNDLPGPIGYWAGQALVVGFVAVGAVGTRRYSGWGTPAHGIPGTRRGERLGADPRARLAVRADLSSLMVPQPVSGRLTLGRLGNRRGPLLATEDSPGPRRRFATARPRGGGRASVIVVGPSQSGKTTGFAIPAVLEWSGPLLVVSVKGDVYEATNAHRRLVGDVKLFDPTRTVETDSSRWSPLARATSLSDAIRAAKGLGAASPGGASEDADIWTTSAEDLIGPLLYAAHLDGRTISDVLRWVLLQDGVGKTNDAERILATAKNAGIGDAGMALDQLKGTWGISDRTRDGVYFSAKAALRPWADPQIADSAEAPDITGDWLLSGPNTLYVCAPSHQQSDLTPVFIGVVSEILNRAYEKAQRRRGGNLAHRLLVVIDEAANVAPLRELPRYAATAAGHGIQLVTIWQDLAQIRTRYGSAAATVLNNHLAKVFLTGISDPDTLEMVSRLLGDEEYAQVAHSAQLDRGSSSVSETVGTRRLAPMDLIRRMPPGQGCLIYGSLPPAHVYLRPYFSERHLARLVHQSPETVSPSVEPDDAGPAQDALHLGTVGQERQ